MGFLLIAGLILGALVALGALAFLVVLILSLQRTTTRCPRCSRPRGMKRIGKPVKAVTRQTLVTEAGSPNVVAQDEQVDIPLSDFEVLYRCQFCGYEETRIQLQLDVEETPYTVW
jgi:hypothetical protein